MRRRFVANISRLIWTVIVLTAVATFVAEFRPWIATWAISASGDNGGTSDYQLIGLMVPAAAVLAAAVWAALGLLIYRRRSGDLFGLAVSLVFVLFGIADTGALSLGNLADAWSLPARALHGLSNTLLITVGYLIPNGRFVPRWSIWLAAAFAVWTAVGIAVPTIDPMTARGGWQLLFLLFLLSTLVSLGYRYARRATAVERLQIKWVIFGAVVAALVYVTTSIVEYVWRPLGDARAAAFVLASGLEVVFELTSLVLALTYAFAILRYRLYDIDLVINRALVYGATTATIALTFWAGILSLQALLRPITSGSELAVAASTLASFALFQPIRRRVQDAVDRRFYRARYDAARTLDAFAKRMSYEVEFDALRSDLFEAVDQTMTPAAISLWLRERLA